MDTSVKDDVHLDTIFYWLNPYKSISVTGIRSSGHHLCAYIGESRPLRVPTGSLRAFNIFVVSQKMMSTCDKPFPTLTYITLLPSKDDVQVDTIFENTFEWFIPAIPLV